MELTMATYTKKEIAQLLGVTTKTIAVDAAHLELEPTIGDRNSKLYSQSDFNLIKQMRSHCADKSNSRESFVPNTEVEVLEPEPAVYKLHNSPGEISIKARHKDTISESLEFGLSQDPLFDLEVLQRIADNHWLLPAARLAPILGITPAYLNSKKTYLYCGFMASKEVYGSNKAALWRITASNYTPT